MFISHKITPRINSIVGFCVSAPCGLQSVVLCAVTVRMRNKVGSTGNVSSFAFFQALHSKDICGVAATNIRLCRRFYRSLALPTFIGTYCLVLFNSVPNSR